MKRTIKKFRDSLRARRDRKKKKPARAPRPDSLKRAGYIDINKKLRP